MHLGVLLTGFVNQSCLQNITAFLGILVSYQKFYFSDIDLFYLTRTTKSHLLSTFRDF